MSNLTLPSVNAADSAASPIGQAKRQSRTLVACSIGNAFEMYGSTVYSFFATSIGRLLFAADHFGETLYYRVADGSQQLVRRTGDPVADGYASRRRVRQRAVRDSKHLRRAARWLRAARRHLVALQDRRSAIACDLHTRMLGRHLLRVGPLHECVSAPVCKLDGAFLE